MWRLMLTALDATEFRHDHLDRVEATPVLYWATWCGFCARVLPHFSERAKAAEGEFLTVDVSDDDSPVWDRFGVRVVPTVALYREGREVRRREGVLTAEDVDAVVAGVH